MKNIVLARVDDRLIHTEILTLWVPEVRANRIIIVDDVVAKDKFRSKVIKEMAPQGLIIHVYGIDRATEKLKEAPSFDGERVIVIAESPLVFEELIKRGIKINQLNIGGMGIRGERKAVARRVACDTMEMEAIHELIKKHVHVYFQTVPTRSSDWKAYIIPVLYVIVAIISMRITNPTKTNKKATKENKDEKALSNPEDEFDPMAQMNKNMNMMFPVMYLAVALIAPLGLALYWLMNSLLMIIERLILNKLLKDEEE